MKTRTSLKSGSACYTVAKGDSLSTIAKQYYGNVEPSSVMKIYAANKTAIGANPDLIQPGMKLYIPN